MTGLPLDAWRAAAQRVLNDGVQDAIPLREWPAALDFLADVGTPHNFIDLMDALTAEREKVVVLQAKYDALVEAARVRKGDNDGDDVLERIHALLPEEPEAR